MLGYNKNMHVKFLFFATQVPARNVTVNIWLGLFREKKAVMGSFQKICYFDQKLSILDFG